MQTQYSPEAWGRLAYTETLLGTACDLQRPQRGLQVGWLGCSSVQIGFLLFNLKSVPYPL